MSASILGAVFDVKLWYSKFQNSKDASLELSPHRITCWIYVFIKINVGKVFIYIVEVGSLEVGDVAGNVEL